MPKILPTFAAIAIIGVCTVFNTVRYPIVWDMVGPNGRPSSAEKNASMAAAASSPKSEPSPVVAQNPPKLSSDPSPEEIAVEKDNSSPIAAEKMPKPSSKKRARKSKPPVMAKEDTERSETPALPKAVPISVPAAEPAAGDFKQEASKTENADNNNHASAAEDNLVEPARRLVPVASDPFTAGSPGTLSNEIHRLPPIETAAASANNFAAGYPNAAFPIYPSTGK